VLVVQIFIELLCLPGFLHVLLVFVVIDYITGVMCAIYDHDLSSEIGFKGISQKVLIFLMVGLGTLLDSYILGDSYALRTAITFFYISNEGISILENAVHLGLPVPEKLKQVLALLHKNSESEKKEDNKDETE
jgi:toxin secretion/phage lysis holin